MMLYPDCACGHVSVMTCNDEVVSRPGQSLPLPGPGSSGQCRQYIKCDTPNPLTKLTAGLQKQFSAPSHHTTPQLESSQG